MAVSLGKIRCKSLIWDVRNSIYIDPGRSDIINETFNIRSQLSRSICLYREGLSLDKSRARPMREIRTSGGNVNSMFLEDNRPSTQASWE